ncbi:two-partner secretion domain-containing protein [Yoonia sediminilitoris]|uniref:Filamentous hemagglutinin family protein n=1 Tax=Yoonia sediminilitoris TaxID=1286148 RepID=A0A2T6KM45_9RHOB|nr:filamentous hemagglutinin N-terminal domain-containing protein [Yoonia sediminilitoris]PUB17288.1 filamentous hemagglutinin family protein [Yoonia sediminilitoris]RCW97583.1 filamentous hemagglutinin family protein [Yoonia sediminilitoris]
MATTKTGSVSRATSVSERKTRLLTALVCCVSPLALFAQDLPVGGNVVSGNAQISTPSANQMTVDQGSDRAVIDWNSFDVGAGAELRFNQPSTSSAVLNRVTGNTTTDIHGRLTANGSVHIVNPNGILIGPGGTVQAGGGFVASTLDITNDDFMNGNLRYSGNGQSATVENAGTITVGRGGYATLLGGHVKNSGVIAVPMGRVGFGSGERATLDLSGDGFLQVAVPTDADSAEGEALIENAGTVSAEGGIIEMRAATARDAARNAINLSGVAEATSVRQVGGAIVLGGGSGGQVNVSGRVSTRTKIVTAVDTSPRPTARPRNTGGEILITGADISLEGATLDASGTEGGGLIRVGGDFAGAGDVPRAQTLQADSGTLISADALMNGDGGRIVLWSDILTETESTLSARGGANSGDGGFVEVSSARTLQFAGLSDTRAPNGATGTLLLDPTNITINPGADELSIEAALTTNNVVLDTSPVIGGTPPPDPIVNPQGEVPPGEDPGNITINAEIDWTSTNRLTLLADNNIDLNGAINGRNGTLVLSAGVVINLGSGTVVIPGDITATGTVDVGTFILSRGDWNQLDTLSAFSAGDFQLRDGTSFLRGENIDGEGTVGLRDVYGLQGMTTLPDQFYVQLEDIRAEGTSDWNTSTEELTGFDPIGSRGEFTGSFDGQNFIISGLTIFGVGDAGRDTALFDTVGANGNISNVVLEGANIAGNSAAGIAVTNNGNISAVSVAGSIVGSGPSVGGIVAENNGSLVDSRSSASVRRAETTDNPLTSIGGAVGSNDGTIARVHATGDVEVLDRAICCLSIAAGGFVGDTSGGSIIDSYAQGDVTVTTLADGNGEINPRSYVGGFVGQADSADLISRSYASGAVTRTASGATRGQAGGFAGIVFEPGGGGSNFWDVVSSGLTTSDMGTGLTTDQFQDTETFLGLGAAQGWTFTGPTAPWAPGDDLRYPTLYSTSQVVFIEPAPVLLSIIYGETDNATTLATATGGPGRYAFDRTGDPDFDFGLPIGGLNFADENVGSTTFDVGLTTLDTESGDTYDVVDRLGSARITARGLLITADDVVKTYGTDLVLGVDDITVSGTASEVPSGLVAGDSVTAITLTSEGAPGDVLVSETLYDIIATDAGGTGLANYDISYVDGSLVVAPAPLLLSSLGNAVADDQPALVTDEDYVVSSPLFNGDRIDSVLLDGEGALRNQLDSAGPLPVLFEDTTGVGMANYAIVLDGLTSEPAVVEPTPGPGPTGSGESGVIALPPVPFFDLPNPVDVLPAEFSLALSPITVAASVGSAGASDPVGDATEGLAKARVAADGLTDKVRACSGNSEDVEAVLACLSDALNDFAVELDRIVLDLPPELGNVAQIIQDARQGVDAARARATARLSTATTEAERRAISTDALNEARAAVDAAGVEVRKALSLVRVADPELAGIQRATITTVAAAVDGVSIELARVTGL